jgi:alpha-tubulin suppressor-like RCC1 family protein
VPVAGGHDFEELGAALFQSCGRRTDGEVWCWGRRVGAEGQAEVPEPLPGNVRFRTFSLGAFHGCGVDQDGAGHCWGANTMGALGHPDAPSLSLEPQRVAGDDRYRDLTAGAMNYCGVTDEGALRCWGRNDNGELADGTSESRSEPVPAAGGPDAWDRVEGARPNSIWVHLCGLEQGTGAAWCWGLSHFGQVGPAADETCGPLELACARTPLRVPGGLQFIDLALGGGHTCGLTGEGELFCWGSNAQGQFGNGTQADATEPVPGGTRG